MTAPSTFVYLDGAKITGDPEKIKALVEFYVDAKVKEGSGAQVVDASPDMRPWLQGLSKRYPWNP